MQPLYYIILLGAVIAVLAYAMPRQQLTNKKADNSEQLEHILEHYFLQAEQDHDSLVQLVKETQQSAHTQGITNEQRVKQLEEQLIVLARQLEQQEQEQRQSSSAINPSAAVAEVATTIDIDEISAEETTSIQHRYKQLLELYHSGKSIDTIAKQMQLNKGEVQLIIQLARQEEKQRA